MTILPTPADYTDKDFESLNRRAEHLLQAVFTAWTDFNRASFQNMLKELFAFFTDVATFTQDQQAGETRWGTCQLRKSMIELARLINYALGSAGAATVDVVFTMPRVLPGDVTIPAGTVVKTVGSNPVRFHTLTAATITSGNTDSGSVSARHSDVQQDTFTAKGESGEEFILTQRPFLDASEGIRIAGDLWTLVDNFLDSTATDKHYVLFVDEEDIATARVGDGTNGVLPTLGDGVVVDYETGGGTAGNVEAGTLKKVEGSFSDSLGNPTSMVSNNAAAAVDGTPREQVAEARIAAPRSLRVLNRSIARTDWEDLAIQITGVGRALMLTKDEDPTIPTEGRGYLFIVPDTGGVPSAALKTLVETTINDGWPIPLNFSWEARDPAYETINVVAYVYLAAGATETTVEAAALAALRAYFAPVNADGTPNTQIDFGYNYKDAAGVPEPLISLSTIKNLIRDLSLVRRLGTPDDGEGLTLNGAEDNVDLILREFPAGGTLTLYDGDTSTIFSGHPVAI
jgi:hypothetical protein